MTTQLASADIGTPARTSLRRSYAELPALAGPAFLPVGFAARLPFSMMTIGTLLLVTATSGSLALAGLVTGAGAIGTAVGGPLMGALADRLGQRRVLLVVVPAQALAVLGLVVAATAGTPTAVLLLVAGLTGALAPQIGPLARVRWIGLARGDRRRLDAAMSYESTADEIGFVLGPALVGIVSAVATPQAALLGAAAWSLCFGLTFALHPTATAAPRSHAPGSDVGTGGSFVALLLSLAVPVLGMLALGAFFGSTQTAVTGFMTAAGHAEAAGVVYAALGLGSAVTALAVVALPRRWGPRLRWSASAVGLTLMSGALVAVAAHGGTGALVVGLLVTGAFVGPVIVTIFTVGGDRAPEGRSGTAMTLLASANVVGVAVGASLTGSVAEAGGAVLAFLLPLVAATLLAVAGMSLTSRHHVTNGSSREVAAGVG